MSNDKWVEEFENKMQYVFRVIRKESLGIEQKEKFVYCDVLTEFKDFIKQLLEEQRKEIGREIFKDNDIEYALNYCYLYEQQEIIKQKYLGENKWAINQKDHLLKGL